MKQNVLLTISELVINNQRCVVNIPLQIALELPTNPWVPVFANIPPKDYVRLAIEVLAYDNVHGTLLLGYPTKQDLARGLTPIVKWPVDRRNLSQRLDDVDDHHHQAILQRITELQSVQNK